MPNLHVRLSPDERNAIGDVERQMGVRAPSRAILQAIKTAESAGWPILDGSLHPDRAFALYVELPDEVITTLEERRRDTGRDYRQSVMDAVRIARALALKTETVAC